MIKLVEKLTDGDVLFNRGQGKTPNNLVLARSIANCYNLYGQTYPAYATVRSIEIKRTYTYVTFANYSIVKVKNGTGLEIAP